MSTRALVQPSGVGIVLKGDLTRKQGVVVS